MERIEHRLFSFITMNWKAEPLISHRVIVDLKLSQFGRQSQFHSYPIL